MHPAHTEFVVPVLRAWRRWLPRRLAGSRGAIRPERIVIRGPLVHLYHGADTAIWRRGLVHFSVPRPTDAVAGRRLRRCIVANVTGGAPRVLDCRAFADDTFTDLVRHLRNFESIGDSAQDPWDLSRLTAPSP